MQDGGDEWQVVQRACDKATAVADAAEPFGAADATIGALPQLHFLRLYAQLAALLLRADAETPEILAKAMDTLTAALDTGAPTYTRPYLLRAALPLLRASNAAAAAGGSAAACAADVQQCSAILNCLLDLEDSVRSADLDAPAAAAATAAPLPRALRQALERELAVAAHWAYIADSAARPMIAADAARELKDRPAMTQSALDLMGPMLLF
ncbi:hypothetical protein JKP88DRAFT_236421 [Tribonema minus]|uniref:Uncharacterized protein n=1 Tax=Tribonema minus TaxID=303371 RepID=A0A835Z456_9STRA|nr:hypothetical protein JKP88DRAFT_236421 [Tribonema minus]